MTVVYRKSRVSGVLPKEFHWYNNKIHDEFYILAQDSLSEAVACLERQRKIRGLAAIYYYAGSGSEKNTDLYSRVKSIAHNSRWSGYAVVSLRKEKDEGSELIW